MKIVLNKCFGGFGISRKAAEFMASRGNEQAKAELVQAEKDRHWFGYGYADAFSHGYQRTDPDLIAAVETLGTEADGEAAKLRVVEIPDGVEWELDEYDGIESIHEVHRSW